MIQSRDFEGTVKVRGRSKMQQHRWIIGAVLLGLSPGCGMYFPALVLPPPPAEEFFGPDRPAMMDDSMARYLWSMGQPSLWQKRLEPGVEQYRLILVPSFDRRRVVGIQLDAATVVVIHPGRMLFPREYLSEDQALAMRRAIKRLDFWKMSAEKPHPMLDLILDGTRWVMEGVKDGSYHAIVRHSPDGPWICRPGWIDVALRAASRSWDPPERSTVEEHVMSNRRLAEFGQFVSETVGIDGWTIKACSVDEGQGSPTSDHRDSGRTRE